MLAAFARSPYRSWDALGREPHAVEYAIAVHFVENKRVITAWGDSIRAVHSVSFSEWSTSLPGMDVKHLGFLPKHLVDFATSLIVVHLLPFRGRPRPSP